MKFTERELTTAIDTVAQTVFAASLKPWQRGKADDAWRNLGGFDKYQYRSQVGESVIPVLIRLPERPTVGAAPVFSQDEYAEAVDAVLAERTDDIPAKHHKVVRAGMLALAAATVQAMPIRLDPDAIIIPDHL